MSFEYHRSPDPQQRGLKRCPRKCLRIYHYLRHPLFGFMHVRIQTWFPFTVQICLNGRECLARQLQRRRSGFQRADNCLPWLANPALARGEFVTAGLRNRDVRAHLYARPKTAVDQRRLSGKVSRQLRLLRAHGVIRKVPKTHRYQLTARGRLLTAALPATRDASIQQLLRDAA